MKKCFWSAKEIKDEESSEVLIKDKTYTVHNNYKKELKEFIDYQNKRKYIFLTFVFVTIIPMFLDQKLIAPMLVLQALNLWVHPFGSPQTVSTIGQKNAILLTRFSSVMLLALSGYIFTTLK